MNSTNDAIATAEYYKWFMYGPVLVPIGTLGIIGNILSIIVFTRPSMKNSALNCILIALAIFDTLYLLSMTINKGAKLTTPAVFHNGYAFILYPITNPIRYFSYLGSIYMTVGLTLERYLSYCHSEKAKTLCTPKKAKLLIALVGLFSLIYNIPAYCEHKYENNNGTISSNQTYLAKHEFYKLVYRAWIGFIVRFVIPTICLVVFNIKIIRKLREVGKKFEDLAVRRGSKMKTINPKSYQKKMTKMSLGLIFVFVFCNSFLQIYFILQGAKILVSKDIASIYLYPTALVFTTLNSSINVIFYSIYNPEFKTTFVRLFCPWSKPEPVVIQEEEEEYSRELNEYAPLPLPEL